MQIVRKNKSRQPKFTLDNEKLQQLERIARSLPRVRMMDEHGKMILGDVELVSGERLLWGGVKTFHGEPVKENEVYRMRKPLYEDHLQNLISSYQSGGNPEVQKYTKYMRRKGWKSLPAKAKIKALWMTLMTLLRITKRPNRNFNH